MVHLNGSGAMAGQVLVLGRYYYVSPPEQVYLQACQWAHDPAVRVEKERPEQPEPAWAGADLIQQVRTDKAGGVVTRQPTELHSETGWRFCHAHFDLFSTGHPSCRSEYLCGVSCEL